MNTTEVIVKLVQLIPVFYMWMFISAPIWLRPINELTTRILGEAVVFSKPHYLPKVAKTENPKVVQ